MRWCGKRADPRGAARRRAIQKYKIWKTKRFSVVGHRSPTYSDLGLNEMPYINYLNEGVLLQCLDVYDVFTGMPRRGIVHTVQVS